VRIALIGTGALASLFAARLSRSGADVLMLGSWQAQIETVQREGMQVIGLDGTTTVQAVRASADFGSHAPVQAAIVLVKSWQTPVAVERVRAVLARSGVVLTLQNGLGNHEQFVAAFGPRRAAVGVTTLGATLERPGVVRHAGEGPIMLAESADLLPPFARLETALLQAGFEVVRVKSAESVLWGKVAINAAINPLTAIHRIPNGELLERPDLLPLMESAATEAQAVAAALGIALPFPDAAAQARAVARQTAGNRSSMLQDVEKNRPTEIDAICGAIVRAGEQTGVPTPVNRRLLEQLRSQPESRL
jgi:2-dehydropantoate 2-reductase